MSVLITILGAAFLTFLFTIIDKFWKLATGYTDKGGREKKKLTPAGFIYIIVSILLIGSSAIKDYLKQNKSSPQIVTKYISKTDTVERKPQEVSSFVIRLHLASVPTANPLFKTDSSRWTFIIYLQTSNNQIITDIRDKNVLLAKTNGQLIYLGSTSKNAANRTTTVGLGTWEFIGGGPIYPPYILPDTMYYCTRFIFSDENHKRQPDFEGIFLITKKFIGSSLPDASEDEFNEVDKFLRKNKMW